jgi:hypothetical protein
MKRTAIVLLLAAGLVVLVRVFPTVSSPVQACTDDGGAGDDDGDDGGEG